MLPIKDPHWARSGPQRTILCAALGLLLAGLLVPPRPLAACGSPSFCGDTLALNGNATLLAPGELQLTNGGTWERGSAWDPNTVDLTQNFSFTFSMYFGTNTSGADGMAFVLQSAGTTAIGNDGGNLGYGGLATFDEAAGVSITPSVAVEFDTFQNSASNLPNTNDPAYDHIMIDEEGDVIHAGSCPGSVVTNGGACPVQASASESNIKDGLYHTVTVAWNASTKVMTVTFDGSLRLTYTKDLANQIFNGGTCVYAGFTGASGGATNDQRVRFCPVLTDTADCGSGITVDGTMNESAWSAESWTPITRVVSGSTAVTGQYKALWSPTYLYVGLQVSDTALHDNGCGYWTGSSAEIDLDTADSPSGPPLSGTSSFHYGVLYDGTCFDSTGGNTGSAGVLYAATNNASGYTMEWAIPWTTLGVSPAAGNTYGFDIGLNVAAGGGRTAQLAWQGDANDYLQTLNFGKLQLGACGTPTATPTPSASPSTTVSASVSPTLTRTLTATPSLTQSPSPSATPSRSPSLSPSPSVTLSPAVSPTPSASGSPVPTVAPTACGGPSFTGGELVHAGQMGNSVLSLTYSYTVPSAVSNALVLVEIEEQSGATAISSMTFGGQPVPQALTNTSAAGGGNLMIYAFTTGSLAAGATSLVMNFGSATNNDQWVVQLQVYGGVNQSTPFGNNLLEAQTAAGFTDTFSTSAANSLVVDFLDNTQNNFPTGEGPGQTYTGITGSTSGYAAWSDTKAAAGAGVQNLTYTWTPSSQTIESWLLEIEGAPCSSPTPTVTPTWSPTLSATPTPSASPTSSPSPSRSATPSLTPTDTQTDTPTASPTASPSATHSPQPTATPTISPSPLPSATPTPLMAIVKSANLSQATIGSTITYTLAYSNDSSAAVTMNLWDTISSFLTYKGSSPAGTVAGGVISWSIAGVPSNGNGSVTFWAVVSGYP